MIRLAHLDCRTCGCELIELSYALGTYICPRCQAAGMPNAVHVLRSPHQIAQRRRIMVPCITPGCPGRAMLPLTLCLCCQLRPDVEPGVRDAARSAQEPDSPDDGTIAFRVPTWRETAAIAGVCVLIYAGLRLLFGWAGPR